MSCVNDEPLISPYDVNIHYMQTGDENIEENHFKSRVHLHVS